VWSYPVVEIHPARIPFALRRPPNVTNPFRLLAGCVVVAGGLCLLDANAPDAAAADPAIKDSYKKAADADIAFLKKRLDEVAKMDDPAAGAIKPAAGSAMLIAVYADVLGDKALKEDALKIVDLVNDKKFKDAATAAGKLAVKPGTPGKGELPKVTGFEAAKTPRERDAKYLEHAMTLFRNKVIVKTPGGMHMQQDIRDYVKAVGPKPIVPADVELLAARVAIISEFALKYPNDKATTKAGGVAEWAKLSKESIDLSNELAKEAANAKPNEMVLKQKLGLLNARCNDCHSKFRDEE